MGLHLFTRFDVDIAKKRVKLPKISQRVAGVEFESAPNYYHKNFLYPFLSSIDKYFILF